ncbi:MAG: CBS domain-containing protein [Saccharopolyspora rectivirgula]
MRVAEVFHPGMLSCAATDSLEAAAAKMNSARVGALAVLDGDQVVGILSERDVVRAVAEQADLRTTTAVQFCSRQVETAAPDEDTRSVARRMLDAGIRHLPVREGTAITGIVSMRDLLAVETWL